MKEKEQLEESKLKEIEKLKLISDRNNEL